VFGRGAFLLSRGEKAQRLQTRKLRKIRKTPRIKRSLNEEKDLYSALIYRRDGKRGRLPPSGTKKNRERPWQKTATHALVPLSDLSSSNKKSAGTSQLTERRGI